jgi:hypothetical protein
MAPSVSSPIPKTGTSLTGSEAPFCVACREANIEDFHFHDLRHTTGTRLAYGGVDAFAIAELPGHRELKTTTRYTHAKEARRRRAVEDLVGYGHGIVTKKKSEALRAAGKSLILWCARRDSNSRPSGS